MRVLIFLTIQIFYLNIFAQSQRQCVFFENNVYELSQEQKKEIDDLMKKLDTTFYLRLVGYANRLGSYQSNLKLSENRVKSIKEYIIIKKYPISKIEVSYHGENQAKMNKNSEIESRRVDIIYDIMKSEKFELNPLALKNPIKFKIDSKRDTILICPEGSKIHYLANSLVKEDGKKISNESIEIRVQEFYKKSDFVLNGLHTQSGDQLLESGGMLNIEAYQGKEKLKLESDRKIKLEFLTKEKKDGMQIFNGDMSHGRMDWKAESAYSESVLSMGIIPSDADDLDDYCGLKNLNSVYGLTIDQGKTYHWFYIGFNEKNLEIEKLKGTEVKAVCLVGKGNFIAHYKFLTRTNTKLDEYVDCDLQSFHHNEGENPKCRIDTIIYLFNDKRAQIRNFLRKNSSESLQKKLDSLFYIDLDSISKNCEAAYEKSIKDRVENNSIKSNELTSYILESTKLGWINCDRFYNKEQVTVAVNLDKETDPDINFVFKNINSVIPYFSNSKRAHRINKLLPKNEEVSVFAIRRENGKTYYALKEFNTNEEKVSLDRFVEVSVEELKEIAKKLDE